MSGDNPVSITVTPDCIVSGVARIPTSAESCFIFAHGAGAGMFHPFMQAVADGLQARRIASLRYQFPYMEQHSRRPDPAPLCHATVRAAVAAAHDLLPGLPLFAGGKSFGGRMTSQTQAASPLPHVRGLCFFGFPLHPAKKPSVTRAEHLSRVTIPMLFLQGTRDALAELDLIRSEVEKLDARATLKLADQADHSFHVPARSGKSDSQILEEMLGAFATWTQAVTRA
jgi:predicted alpha/beta-hydrolase family hydrolase